MSAFTSKDFDIDVHIQVINAYLKRSESHRYIQKNILGLPAPSRGGGFVAMEILHNYDIREDKKGILIQKTLEDELAYAKGQYYFALEMLLELESFKNKVKNVVATSSETYEIPLCPTEKLGTAKYRIAQSVIREIVLKNYGRCAVCEVREADLLVCSHIIPWSIDINNRLNPENAICFCTWHDKLFDKGYFGFDSKMNILISSFCPDYIEDKLKHLSFYFPKKFAPKEDFIQYHRNNILKEN